MEAETQKYMTKKIVKQLNRILMNHLSPNAPHLLESQVSMFLKQCTYILVIHNVFIKSLRSISNRDMKHFGFTEECIKKQKNRIWIHLKKNAKNFQTNRYNL